MPEPTGSGDKWPKEFLVRLSGCKKKRLCVSAEQIWRRLVALRRASEKVNIVDGKRGKRALVERTINFSDKMWRGTKVLANMLELCKRKGSLSCWTFYWFLRRRYSLFNSVLFIFSDFSVLLTLNRTIRFPIYEVGECKAINWIQKYYYCFDLIFILHFQ